MDKRVLVIFGTRPEAIKMAPVVKELKKRKGVTPIVCVTAQHRQMLDQVLKLFQIVPDYDLNLMRPNQTLEDITAGVLKGVGKVIRDVQPDLVLVHGDTTTAMTAALAAFYQHIPIGHVEAGLRTYNKYSPFPEEMNRQIIDDLADYLYTPTEASKAHLEKSLNQGQQIFVTGNTAIDALATTVTDHYQNPLLDWIGAQRMVLLTAHRRENLGAPLEQVFSAVKQALDDFPDLCVIYPVHANPKVREIAHQILGNHPRVKLIEPLDVLDFHNLMQRAYFILSDSGGIQEEAPSLGKPVLVIRNTTERPEGIAAGTLKLVGTESDSVYRGMKDLLQDQQLYQKMSRANNPYGDGHASQYIVNTILAKGI